MHHVAVGDRARAARVVAGHPAEGRLRRRADVDREPQSVRLEIRVQLVEHHARLDLDRHRVAIEGADAVEMLALIDDQGSADRLPALRAAGAARQHRHLLLAAERDCRAHIVDGLRDEHADRLDLVDRCVGRVAATRRRVEQHVAFDDGAKASRQPAVGALRMEAQRLRCSVVHRTAEFPGEFRGFCTKTLRAAISPGLAGLRRRSANAYKMSASNPIRRRADAAATHRHQGPLMLKLDSHPSGRHFLQIPGPTNVPDRVLRAIDQPTIDHRGPEFARLTLEILDGLKDVFQTAGPVVIYPASGTGAWEAALVNTLSPGDRVLMFETGHFATLWRAMAEKLGLVVDFVPGDWRSGVDPVVVEAKLAEDTRAHLQGRARRAQRNVDRRDEPYRGGAAGDRSRRPSGAAHGGHDIVAGLHRLSPRRMGRRRHRGGIAKRPDAAAGPVVQRRQREGARREQAGAAAALVLALGRDDRDEPAGLLPVHAGDQSPLRVARGDRDAARRGPAGGVRASPAARRGDAARRPRVGARGALPQPRRVQRVVDGGDDARRTRCRRIPARSARALRHVARHRPRAPRRQRVPHRASRFLQRPHALLQRCAASRWDSRCARFRTRRTASPPRLPGCRKAEIRPPPRNGAPRELDAANRSDNCRRRQFDNEAASETASPARRMADSISPEGGSANEQVLQEERSHWRSRWRASRPSRGSPPSPSRSSLPPAPAERPTRWRE